MPSVTTDGVDYIALGNWLRYAIVYTYKRDPFLKLLVAKGTSAEDSLNDIYNLLYQTQIISSINE
jgi:hypothetical protein